MKFLEYLYCRFYQLMVSVGNGDIAAFASILFMTFILMLNMITIFGIFYIVGHSLKLPYTPVALTVMFCPAIILWFLLVYDGKSSRILNQYANEAQKDKLKGRIIVIVYIVLSIIAMGGSALLMAKKNRGGL